MNTLHFRYALEIEKTRSITQAAENLYMAQPNLSKAIKELAFLHIIFVELRREFHEIGIDIGARKGLIFAFGEQTVQTVSEFMCKSAHFVERE